MHGFPLHPRQVLNYIYRMRGVFCLLALLASLSTPVLAQPASMMDAARMAYRDGHWESASILARSGETVDAQLLAAEALIALLIAEPDHPNREQLAFDALDIAEDAYRADPDRPETRLRLASALGFYGRYLSGWGAYVRRVPHRGRRLLESVVEDDPQNAWAVGMLGAWHLEVARRGGERGMRALNASVESGMGYYGNAIALSPDDLTLRYHFALALIALDEPAYYRRAEQELRTALELEARDAFEVAVKAQAQDLVRLLSNRDSATLWANARLTR